jgi:hypothetical protein
MTTFVFHVDGAKDYDTLRVEAIDETQAKNLLLSQWLDGKPLVSEGMFRLVHVERRER